MKQLLRKHWTVSQFWYSPRRRTSFEPGVVWRYWSRAGAYRAIERKGLPTWSLDKRDSADELGVGFYFYSVRWMP